MTSLDSSSSKAPRQLVSALWRVTRPIRWAVSIGALCGFVAGGVGSRVAMRLIAMADSSTEGTFTDSKATVGDFTAGGTFTLLMLGTVAGVLGGLLYLGIRRWLPGGPAWHGTAFGILTLATVGQPLFDPANVDFQIFEPVLLTLFLFSALFIVNGLLVGRLMERFHPERPNGPRSRVSLAVSGGLSVIAVIGLVGLIGGMLGMVEDEGKCLRAVGGGEGCAVSATE